MKTAEEKREVAENLREQAAYPGSSSMYMEAFIEDLRQIIDPYNMSNSYADLYDILADLIEPGETEQGVASQGLTKEQLEFDWWLSGRVMHELGFDGDTADRDEVESRLLARLMPEGYEWPRYEDGEQVRIGDEFAERIYGNPCKVGHFAINKHAFLIFEEEDVNYCEAINHGSHKRVKRPAFKVLDADGVEIFVGDECYVTSNGDGPYVVCNIREADGAIEMYWHKHKNGLLHIRPDLITHRAPVLASDGKPLREGETVWHVDTGHEYVVVEPSYGDTVVVRLAKYDDAEGEQYAPDQLTHERPDSWERLEDDARQLDIDLNDTTDEYPRMSCCRDLVRRARALADKEER